MRVAALIAGLAASLAASAQEVVTIPTRPGVTESFFIANMGDVKPEAIALLYSGGYGSIRLRLEEGQPRFNEGNFLIRARREFIRNGIQPVLVDVPSDSIQGVTDPYRRSDAQLADFRAVLAEVRKRLPGLPVFVATTSRSTLTAAHLARNVSPEELAGIVFSSSMVAPGRNWENIGSLDPAEVKVPVLFVHHHGDICQATPFSGAERLARPFALVTVNGGFPPKSDPCEPFSAHGYYGKEAPTVDAIAGWMLKKPFQKDIQ
ncbi:MAG: hypothetical protein JO035_12290 [Betaproteobacteria bacterium]|nr:hypothetical protein [Betaproteobacteria bacterium]